MKPPPFAYYAPASKEELLVLLAEKSDETSVLAGGQSLVPQLNQRLVRPSRLIDINEIPELATISVVEDRLVFGATVRLSQAEHSALVRAHCPLISAAIPWVANPQVRNRGTVVGNLVYAARGSEMPAVALTLDAEFKLENSSGTARICSAEAFFLARGGTDRRAQEFVSSVSFPLQSSEVRVAFLEAQRRTAHFSLLGVAVAFSTTGNIIHQARVSLCGVAPGPLRMREVESFLEGKTVDLINFTAAAELVGLAVEKSVYDDLHATRAYRKSVAPHLVRQALATAASL